MSPELDQIVRAAAPEVWGKVSLDVGDGWADILLDLGQELNKLGEKVGVVKEKYACLTVYMSGSNGWEGSPAAQKAVRRAAEKSQGTCEKCGHPGRLVYSEYGYETIACKKCQRKVNL